MQTKTGQKIVCISAAVLLVFVTSARSADDNMSMPHANLTDLPTTTAAAQPVSSSPQRAAMLMVASWYGQKFQGRKTSSGDIFDLNKLTAANKTLPLGSRVKLTVPKTGRSVIVLVNDRGPWLKGRDFDLSEAAAIQLGIHDQGLAKVEMALLK